MLTYRRVIKIAYVLIIAGIAVIISLLIKERALNGNNGQFSVLAAVVVFVIYSGVHIKRLIVNDANQRNVEKYMQELNMEAWTEYHMRLKVCKNKISCIRHDMANHMQVFNNLKDSMGCEYPQKRMAEINRELEKLSQIRYCDNMLIDIAIEEKLAQIMKREIEVYTDICLRNMEEYESEKICLILWMVLDKMSECLKENEKLCIKLYNNERTKDGCIIKWSIEADRAPKEMSALDNFINNIGGSVVVNRQKDSYVMIGMLEAKRNV